MRMVTITILLAGLTACGGNHEADTEGNRADASPTANSAAPRLSDTGSEASAGSETIVATRAQVKQAWKCRGLIAAATAAKKVLPAAEVPNELLGLTAAMSLYWDNRAARLKAPDMSEADVDALVGNSTRMLATREALERELPNITACIAAQEAE